MEGVVELDELNRRLLTLTESERRYRDGESFAWGAHSARVEIDGREMLRFPGDLLSHDGYWRGRPNRSDGRPLEGLITIRQNSRFNLVPEHVHSYMEMSYVYAGSCPQTVRGESLTLRENQVLMLDSDCPHGIGRLEENDIMISVLISKSFLKNSLIGKSAQYSMLASFLANSLYREADHRRFVLFHSEESRRIRCYFQELMCEFFDPSLCADDTVTGLFRLILNELVSVYEGEGASRACSGGDENGVAQAVPIIRYIERHYGTCTLESVASHFFISPGYLSTLLKRHTGMTYMQMVQAQKLSRAATLLRNTSLSVTDAARTAGYDNVSFFYRKFKERYGCLPAEYRRMNE